MRMIQVPVLDGLAQAGRPFQFDDSDFQIMRTRYVPAPLSDLPGDQYMALYVEGESLIDAKIFPGDWVMFRLSDSAPSGALCVVANMDGACVKYYHPDFEEGTVVLKSANSEFPDRTHGIDDVRVRGIVCLIGRDVNEEYLTREDY